MHNIFILFDIDENILLVYLESFYDLPAFITIEKIFWYLFSKCISFFKKIANFSKIISMPTHVTQVNFTAE